MTLRPSSTSSASGTPQAAAAPMTSPVRAAMVTACDRSGVTAVAAAGKNATERVMRTRGFIVATLAELWQSREMSLRALLTNLRARRKRVQGDASDLLTFLGEYAYYEARERARTCRSKRDRAGDRHWSRVAVEIAGREGRVIGETVADGYEAERARPALPSTRREAARALTDLAQNITDMARGRADATTLHNVGVWVRQAITIGGSTPEVVLAGDAVIAACEDLAAGTSQCSAALSAGSYPQKAELAGTALQGLRAAIDARARSR